MDLTKEQIAKAAPLSLFRAVFGLKPEQKLSGFVAEVGGLREDSKFVEEVRAYAMTQATE